VDGYHGESDERRMKLPAKGGPVSRRRAIANLLRLADTDLRDARVLMRNGSLRNAAMLQWSAVSRMTTAIIAPERGSSANATVAATEELKDGNPVKTRLKALEVASYCQRGLVAGGCLQDAPEVTALRDNIESMQNRGGMVSLW